MDYIDVIKILYANIIMILLCYYLLRASCIMLVCGSNHLQIPAYDYLCTFTT